MNGRRGGGAGRSEGRRGRTAGAVNGGVDSRALAGEFGERAKGVVEFGRDGARGLGGEEGDWVAAALGVGIQSRTRIKNARVLSSGSQVLMHLLMENSI